MKVLKSRVKLKVALVIGITLLLIITSSFKPAYSYRLSEYKPLSAAAGLDPRPLNIELSGNGSYVYFTEEYTGRIGAMKTDGEHRQFVEYILPFTPELGYAEPWDLDVVRGNKTDTADTDHCWDHIFYTDYHQNLIGELEIRDDGPHIRTWNIPTVGSGPRGISAANKYDIWFTEFYANKIGRLYYDSSVPGWFIIEYPLPSGSNPLDIICVGDAVWFTEYGRNRIGMINATTGVLYEYSVGGNAPWGITVDPDGMVWYTVSGGSGYIARLNPWTREVVEHKGLPTSYSQPRDIAIDNYTRMVWFTEFTGHKVVLYRPGENLFYEFPTLTPSSSPSGITLYRKHASPLNATLNVFFTEWSGNKIGHLYYGSANTDIATYGSTTTIVATELTSAVTGTRRAAIATSTSSSGAQTHFLITGITANTTYVASGFNGTTTIKTDTAYRLSTSTMGTSTSYITEVVHTTTTSTSTSYRYVSTVSLTSTNLTTSTSTTYVATSSITYMTTSYETVYTSTMSLTSTSTVSRTDTLTTTVYHTKYKSTTSATTTTTETHIVPHTNTVTETTTIATTVTGTPTTVTTTPTVTPTFTFPFNISCLIATAAYGSEVSPAVQYLRDFRDNLVMHTFAGSSFMQAFNAWYYSFSPYIADMIRPSPTVRAAVRAALYPLFGVLKLSAATFYGLSWVNPEFAIVAAGLLASGLIGLIYDTPLILAGLLYARKRWRIRLKYKWFSKWLVSVPAVIGLSLACIALAEMMGSMGLMTASTAALVLSTMIGSALTTALWLNNKIMK